MAKQLSHDFKFSARTDPRIFEALSTFVVKAGMRGVKFRGRKVGIEAAINAILTDFVAHSEADQQAILERGLTSFTALLADDAPQTKTPPAAPAQEQPGARPEPTTPHAATVSPSRDPRTGHPIPKPQPEGGRRKRSS